MLQLYSSRSGKHTPNCYRHVMILRIIQGRCIDYWTKLPSLLHHYNSYILNAHLKYVDKIAIGNHKQILNPSDFLVHIFLSHQRN